jgi:hypothetical protein
VDEKSTGKLCGTNGIQQHSRSSKTHGIGSIFGIIAFSMGTFSETHVLEDRRTRMRQKKLKDGLIIILNPQ